MVTQRRFSKAVVAEWASLRILELESLFQFDRKNGYAQVENSSPERNRAYGEWNSLRNLMDVFEL